MKPGKALWFPLLWLMLIIGTTPVQAAVPYASDSANRQARQAAPPPGRALVYLYRTRDSGPSFSPAIRIGNRPLAGLASDTFYYWSVSPGRLSIRAGESPVFVMNIQAGRIYFVRLVASSGDQGELQQVSYGAGRRGVQHARLVRETAPVAKTARTAPKPVRKPAHAEESAPVPRSSFNLILKGGSFSLASADQNIEADAGGIPTTFKTSFTQAAPIFGLEGEWYGESGWAFGAEVLSHKHEYTTVPGALGKGDMQVVTITANGKKYFRPGSVVQPFLGAGLGVSTMSMSGQLEGSSTGYAVQAMAGVAFRWQYVGLYTEVKYQLAESADVSASGPGLFAGFGVHF